MKKTTHHHKHHQRQHPHHQRPHKKPISPLLKKIKQIPPATIIWSLLIFGLVLAAYQRPSIDQHIAPKPTGTTTSSSSPTTSESTTPAPTPTTSPSATTSETPTAKPTKTATSSPSSIPATFAIKNVPFIQQAPLKNWDDVHEETCEEAALLTVHHFLKGDSSVDLNQQEAELQDIVKWENDNLGFYKDTTVAQTARIAQEDLGYGDKVHILTDVTTESLEKEIAAGHPVIIPTNGQRLNNPHFKQPGPIYHMIVLTGYDIANFISDDPGTQYGQNYRYSKQTINDALHDFVDHTDAGMQTGAKTAFTIY